MIDRCFRGVLLPALALAIASGAAVPAKAEVGVTNSTITFGQSAALEGPAAALGTGMRAGILAAFAEANSTGGIAGRQPQLKSYDEDRKSVVSGTSVSVRVALGGGRIIKKKT